MKEYTKILSIAGSDSGGGAGIQADIKTISALGGYASTAITAITAQNTVGVNDVLTLDGQMVEAQIRSVMDDIGADAVKIGMLSSEAIVCCVANALRGYIERGVIRFVVLDPVLVATSGDQLSGDDVIGAMVKHLFPLCTLLTPNIPEAERLTGMSLKEDGAERIAQRLIEMGAPAVLIKGGHNPHEGVVRDRLYTADGYYEFQAPFYDTPNKHGTGCSLSSAIATLLAQGLPLREATQGAIEYVGEAIKAASEYTIGKGHGPIKHFYRVW
ncbi:MAG: bifunctional hydroxymethylpyrimidine kinase/phosphomethylpyrimidine kinase [Rikenellaceae bacterium]